jgi:hypothetical protein
VETRKNKLFTRRFLWQGSQPPLLAFGRGLNTSGDKCWGGERVEVFREKKKKFSGDGGGGVFYAIGLVLWLVLRCDMG